MNNLRKQLNELLDKFEEELKISSNTDLNSKTYDNDLNINLEKRTLNYFKFVMIKAILKSKTFSEFKMCLRLYNRMNKITYRKNGIVSKENNLRKLLNAVK